jgi:hypothetical protein
MEREGIDLTYTLPVWYPKTALNSQYAIDLAYPSQNMVLRSDFPELIKA